MAGRVRVADKRFHVNKPWSESLGRYHGQQHGQRYRSAHPARGRAGDSQAGHEGNAGLIFAARQFKSSAGESQTDTSGNHHN